MFASRFLTSVKPKPQVPQICFPQAKDTSFSQDSDSSLKSGVVIQVQRAFWSGGFPGGAVVEGPPADAGDAVFVTRYGRIPHAAERLGP